MQATTKVFEDHAQAILSKYTLALRMLYHIGEEYEAKVKAEKVLKEKQQITAQFESEVMKEKKTADCLQKIRTIKNLLGEETEETPDIPAAMSILNELEEMFV